jgi:ubiquinone biosynthesis protein Coq4
MNRPASELLRHPIRTLRVVQNFVRTVADPTRSDIQHGINRIIRDTLRETRAGDVARAERAQPGLAALWAERYDPPLERARLEALPDGTLGREYARFIRENAIDPLANLVDWGAPQSFAEYAVLRAYKLHDVLHVVLGCDATVMGEVRIVSFSLGQGRGERPRGPALALAVLFLHLALFDPTRLREAIALAAEWLALGRRALSHAEMRLEEYLDRPLADARTALLGADAARVAA